MTTGFPAFLPEIVLRNIIESDAPVIHAPKCQEFDTVALFIDVSHFSFITEHLAQKGPNGIEELGAHLNGYLDKLTKILSRNGGDVFKFAGDAMLVLWPPPDEKSRESSPQPTNVPAEAVVEKFTRMSTQTAFSVRRGIDKKLDLRQEIDKAVKEKHLEAECEEQFTEQNIINLRRACKASLKIQESLSNFRMSSDVEFSVKIGIGVGRATVLHVGGVFNRLEYLACGPSLMQAFRSEGMSQPGWAVMSAKAYEHVKDFFDAAPLPDGKHVKLEKIVRTIKSMPIQRTIQMPGGDETAAKLGQYIPAAVLPFATVKNRFWSAELRQVSVIFANLGFEGSELNSVSTDASVLARVQDVISTVQSAVYLYEGSLNKFLVDDKGSTLVAVFGLPPVVHEDDPLRAITCALTMRHHLNHMGLKCAIGVTTGAVLCGLIGSDTRREYSILGDVVNLAARLMQAADGGILLDAATRLAVEESGNRIMRFEKLPLLQVKGKSKPVLVFTPVIEPQMLVAPTRHLGASLVELLENPLTRDGKCVLPGRSEVMAELQGAVGEALSSNAPHLSVLLTGARGVGKSCLLQFLARVFTRVERPMMSDLLGDASCPAPKPPLVLTAAGNFLATEFDVWRQVFVQLCLDYRVPQKGPRPPVTPRTMETASLSSHRTHKLVGENQDRFTTSDGWTHKGESGSARGDDSVHQSGVKDYHTFSDYPQTMVSCLTHLLGSRAHRAYLLNDLLGTAFSRSTALETQLSTQTPTSSSTKRHRRYDSEGMETPTGALPLFTRVSRPSVRGGQSANSTPTTTPPQNNINGHQLFDTGMLADNNDSDGYLSRQRRPVVAEPRLSTETDNVTSTSSSGTVTSPSPPHGEPLLLPRDSSDEISLRVSRRRQDGASKSAVVTSSLFSGVDDDVNGGLGSKAKKRPKSLQITTDFAPSSTIDSLSRIANLLSSPVAKPSPPLNRGYVPPLSPKTASTKTNRSEQGDDVDVLLDPELRKEAFELLLTVLKAAGPLIIILDDMQYMSPLDGEFCCFLLNSLHREPVPKTCHISLVMSSIPLDDDTYKPRFSPVPAHYTTIKTHDATRHIVLDPLDKKGIAEMLTSLWKCSDVSWNIVEKFAAVTAGNPLFVQKFAEQLVHFGHIAYNGSKCFLTERGLGRGNPFQTVLPVRSVANRVLMARFDRLSSSRQISLKVASVLALAKQGLDEPVFRLGALRAIHPLCHSEMEMMRDMDYMEQLGFVERVEHAFSVAELAPDGLLNRRTEDAPDSTAVGLSTSQSFEQGHSGNPSANATPTSQPSAPVPQPQSHHGTRVSADSSTHHRKISVVSVQMSALSIPASFASMTSFHASEASLGNNDPNSVDNRVYRFRCGQIREMLYGLLLHAQRRRIHGNIVERLEESVRRLGSVPKEALDLIARHKRLATMHCSGYAGEIELPINELNTELVQGVHINRLTHRMFRLNPDKSKLERIASRSETAAEHGMVRADTAGTEHGILRLDTAASFGREADELVREGDDEDGEAGVSTRSPPSPSRFVIQTAAAGTSGTSDSSPKLRPSHYDHDLLDLSTVVNHNSSHPNSATQGASTGMGVGYNHRLSPIPPPTGKLEQPSALRERRGNKKLAALGPISTVPSSVPTEKPAAPLGPAGPPGIIPLRISINADRSGPDNNSSGDLNINSGSGSGGGAGNGTTNVNNGVRQNFSLLPPNANGGMSGTGGSAVGKRKVDPMTLGPLTPSTYEPLSAGLTPRTPMSAAAPLSPHPNTPSPALSPLSLLSRPPVPRLHLSGIALDPDGQDTSALASASVAPASPPSVSAHHVSHWSAPLEAVAPAASHPHGKEGGEHRASQSGEHPSHSQSGSRASVLTASDLSGDELDSDSSGDEEDHWSAPVPTPRGSTIAVGNAPNGRVSVIASGPGYSHSSSNGNHGGNHSGSHGGKATKGLEPRKTSTSASRTNTGTWRDRMPSQILERPETDNDLAGGLGSREGLDSYYIVQPSRKPTNLSNGTVSFSKQPLSVIPAHGLRSKPQLLQPHVEPNQAGGALSQQPLSFRKRVLAYFANLCSNLSQGYRKRQHQPGADTILQSNPASPRSRHRRSHGSSGSGGRSPRSTSRKARDSTLRKEYSRSDLVQIDALKQKLFRQADLRTLDYIIRTLRLADRHLSRRGLEFDTEHVVILRVVELLTSNRLYVEVKTYNDDPDWLTEQALAPAPSDFREKHIFLLCNQLLRLSLWDFNVLELDGVTNGRPLYFVGITLLHKYGLMERLNLDTPTVSRFLRRLENHLQTFARPFHNNIRAAEVAQAVSFFIDAMGLFPYICDVDLFTMIIAALAHDFHNDSMIIEEEDEDSISNVRSSSHEQVMEMLQAEIVGITDKLDYRGQCRAKTLLQQLMFQRTSKDREEFVQRFEIEVLQNNFITRRNKDYLMEAIMRAADVAVAAKPTGIYKMWVQRMIEEKFASGDAQRKLGLPISSGCDRNNPNISELMLEMFDDVVVPVYEVLGAFSPAVRRLCLSAVASHYDGWKRLRSGTITADTEIILQQLRQSGVLKPSASHVHDTTTAADSSTKDTTTIHTTQPIVTGSSAFVMLLPNAVSET